MIKNIISSFQRLTRISGTILGHLYSLENLFLLNGKTLAQINRANVNEFIDDIHLSEFSVFSQFGDDGIIQFLINYLDIKNQTFIEFGVEDYRESNTRFLLMNNNWKGLVMDGSAKNVKKITRSKNYWKYDLTAINAFITRENINFLITDNGFSGEVGLLHIDIDGNDYWVWKEIACISPVIVIVEYNSVFGDEKAWTIPYDPRFYRTNYHHSNLCFGSSLSSLCDLAKEKNYSFIGCNSGGNNAYFIRKDKMKMLKSLNAKEGYVCSRYRECKDTNGNLKFISPDKRLEEIKGVEMMNTRTGNLETI